MKGSAILDGLKNIALISAQDSFKQSLNTEKEMVSVDHDESRVSNGKELGRWIHWNM